MTDRAAPALDRTAGTRDRAAPIDGHNSLSYNRLRELILHAAGAADRTTPVLDRAA